MNQDKSSKGSGILQQYLLFALAIGLAALFSGCYTILQHPAATVTEVADNNSCQRCHLSPEGGGDYDQIWVGHIMESDYGWLNYYENPWWSPTKWARSVRPGSRTRSDGSANRAASSAGNQLATESAWRTNLTPRWNKVLRDDGNPDSLRLGIRQLNINPIITAPKTPTYGSGITTGTPTFGGSGVVPNSDPVEEKTTEDKPSNQVRTNVAPRFQKKTPPPPVEEKEEPAKPEKPKVAEPKKPKG